MQADQHMHHVSGCICRQYFVVKCFCLAALCLVRHSHPHCLHLPMLVVMYWRNEHPAIITCITLTKIMTLGCCALSRQWFEQAWRQSNGRQGRQQQQSQQDRNSSSSYGSYSSRPWWESFHQSFKQQQEQYSQQQQHNHTHHSSQHHQQHHSSSWQQAGTTVRHPPCE